MDSWSVTRDRDWSMLDTERHDRSALWHTAHECRHTQRPARQAPGPAAARAAMRTARGYPGYPPLGAQLVERGAPTVASLRRFVTLGDMLPNVVADGGGQQC